MELTLETQLAALVGYLLGSVPFGVLFTRMAGLGDVRNIGSGNIGATNVLRTGRKGIALATLVCDGGKGAVAALIAARWGAELGLLAGLFAVIGHNFPLWLRFQGGKGVATTLGVLVAVSWPAGLAACATWLLVAAVSRYSSLAALVSLTAAPAYMAYFADSSHAVMAILLALLAWLRHRANVARLIKGEESRIGSKKPAPATHDERDGEEDAS